MIFYRKRNETSKTAKSFFKKSTKQHGKLNKINVDKSRANVKKMY